MAVKAKYVAKKTDFAKALKSEGIMFNGVLHPRIPRGSPNGGEFTVSGGSNECTSTDKPTNPSSGGASASEKNRPAHGQDVPSYGKAIAGAVSVEATHYSTQKLDYLTGDYYGRGLKGAERIRVQEPTADPRIKKRVYFYVDEGHGVVPESGVGSYPHRVNLANLYDRALRQLSLHLQGGGARHGGVATCPCRAMGSFLGAGIPAQKGERLTRV